MAVLYRKVILSSMRCLPCLPLSISLQSFTFSQFAPLSSSLSCPSTPSFNVISELLTKECGFSSSQVTTLMRRQPALLRSKSDHTAREAIRMLKDYGFTDNQLKSTILRNPSILSLKVDERLKPKMEFLKNLGLAPQHMILIICSTPRLLTTSIENTLTPRILHLGTLFGSKDHLYKALRSTPRLLVIDFKTQVIPRVEYLKNYLRIEEGSIAFARTLSAVLHLSFETLEKKTKNLASLGLAEEEIRLMLRGNPIILRSSTKKIKENMDFLINTAGLMLETVASHPMILNFSVEKRLKPRYEIFKYLRTNPHCKCPPSLVNTFELSEKRFLKYFGQYSTQVKSNDIQSTKTSIL